MIPAGASAAADQVRHPGIRAAAVPHQIPVTVAAVDADVDLILNRGYHENQTM
jgi:hypothetical protein